MKLLTLLFCIFSIACFGQSLQPTNQEAIIHFKAYDLTGKPLKTRLYFKNSKKEYCFQTDGTGKADFVVENGTSYQIKIAGSLTYYDYEISDFAGQSLDLELKFDKSVDLQELAYDQQALLIFNAFNLPAQKEIEIIDEDSKLLFKRMKTEAFKLGLPLKKRYSIKVEGFNIENNLITVGDSSMNVMCYLLYISGSNSASLIKSHKEAAFNVIYTNLYSKKPVPNEWITLESKKTKKLLKAKTNENGTVLFTVPQDDRYSIHTTHEENIISAGVSDKESIYLFDCKILRPSTKEIDERKKEDSTRLALRDFAYKKRAALDQKKSSKELKSEVIKEAEDAIKRLDKEPNYFVSSNNPICAVLYRLRNRWKDKMVVTDLTGSMYPYMRQLLMWHCMKMLKDENCDFTFFNDGDNKPDKQKVLGNTGGIYFTQSNETDVVIDKMLETMRNGSGGDGPENDIEALLSAQSRIRKSSELILIADNYAPIKDISLIEQLHLPVRVILCGTDWGINTDYIELAYKTKGSIHTIEQDLMKIDEMVDGKSISIGNRKYIYSKGKFFIDK